MANESPVGSTAKGRGAARNVDEYLAIVPEPARSTLNKIRAVIRSAVPREAIEAISYRMHIKEEKRLQGGGKLDRIGIGWKGLEIRGLAGGLGRVRRRTRGE